MRFKERYPPLKLNKPENCLPVRKKNVNCFVLYAISAYILQNKIVKNQLMHFLRKNNFSSLFSKCCILFLSKIAKLTGKNYFFCLTFPEKRDIIIDKLNLIMEDIMGDTNPTSPIPVDQNGKEGTSEGQIYYGGASAALKNAQQNVTPTTGAAPQTQDAAETKDPKEQKQETMRIWVGLDNDGKDIYENWPIVGKCRGYIAKTHNGHSAVTDWVMGSWNEKKGKEDQPSVTFARVSDGTRYHWRIVKHDRCAKPRSAVTFTDEDKLGRPAFLSYYTKETLDKTQELDKAGKVYGKDYVLSQKDGKTTVHEDYELIVQNKVPRFRNKKTGQILTQKQAAEMGLIYGDHYKRIKDFNDNDRKATGYTLEYNGALADAQKWFDEFGLVGTYFGRVLLGVPKLLGNLWTGITTGNWCHLFSKDTLYDLLCMGATAGGIIGAIHIFKPNKPTITPTTKPTTPTRPTTPTKPTNPPTKPTTPPSPNPSPNPSPDPTPDNKDGPTPNPNNITLNHGSGGDHLTNGGNGVLVNSSQANITNPSTQNSVVQAGTNIIKNLLGLG